jgi:hypothetical protein
LFIAIIDLSRTFVTTATLICNALVMLIIYPWIKIKLNVLIYPAVIVTGPNDSAIDGVCEERWWAEATGRQIYILCFAAE